LFEISYPGVFMMFVIGFLLFAFVVVGIAFYLIEHSPAGYEDEYGFHIEPVPESQLTHRLINHVPNTELVFGNIARYRTHNS
jgi:hypothetical protein